jgi:beta-glucosidase
MKVEIKNNGTDSCYAVVNVTINNVGQKSGKDVTQIYIKKDVNDFTQPSLTLCSFKKTLLEKGEEKQISLLIPSSFFHTFDYNGENQYLNKGSYQIMLGKDSQNIILSTEVTIR